MTWYWLRRFMKMMGGSMADYRMEERQKTVIVTGSTRGIGQAAALKFLGEGHYVILNYAGNDALAEQLDEALARAFPDQYCILKARLSDMEHLERFVGDCLDAMASAGACGIDYLILNAGITDYASWLDISWEDWTRVLDTNLNIPFFAVQQFYPHMNQKGSILLIGSVMGEMPHSVSVAYGVSKAGLHFMAKSLVKACVPKEIRVNAVCPGFVDTPWQEGKEPEHKKRIEEKIACGRFAKPEEVADFCLEVVYNPYINGSVLDIDGGYSYK